jgi:hypothetical protein
MDEIKNRRENSSQIKICSVGRASRVKEMNLIVSLSADQIAFICSLHIAIIDRPPLVICNRSCMPMYPACE